ncbi:orotate phosphoribosyltransferase [mine drainage metagenome]|uniref:orotate phosphoribosyltransferase n=1 Tax=mine drainage metagenome TaxID=410659 RepID=A0A1J5QDB5_9ZZZZ
MTDFRHQFIALSIEKQVLRFGEFVTKAGRKTPYFFNTGLFNDGDSLRQLGQFYAKAILQGGLPFDMLFGPAYKGIPLVAAIAIALSEAGCNVPFSFNRKEVKDHGEGGTIIGAPLKGRVLIVDDVISAGTSVRESMEIIRANGATPCGVFIALDRQERGQGAMSAVQEVEQNYGIPVRSIASLEILIEYLRLHPTMSQKLVEIQHYQREYGIAA